MQKYNLDTALKRPYKDDEGPFYLASEVDARIADLKNWIASQFKGAESDDLEGGWDSALANVEEELQRIMNT